MAHSAEFNRKLALADRYLLDVGLNPRNPYFFHSNMWRERGYEIPPPNFSSFWLNVVVYGMWMAPLFLVTSVYISWPIDTASFFNVVLAAVGGCVVYGTVVAGWFMHESHKYNLPSWGDL